MFIPQSITVGLIINMLSFLGWGTGLIAIKELKCPPPIFLFDFIIFRFIFSLMFCLILGTSMIDSSTGSWFDDFYPLFQQEVFPSFHTSDLYDMLLATCHPRETRRTHCFRYISSSHPHSSSRLHRYVVPDLYVHWNLLCWTLQLCPLTIRIHNHFWHSFDVFSISLFSFLSYFVDSRGNLAFLIPGTLFNIIAIVFDALTYKYVLHVLLHL